MRAGAGVAVVGLAVLGGLVADVRAGGAVASLDAPISTAVFALRSGWLTALMRVVTDSAGTTVMAAVSVAIVIVLWASLRREDAVWVTVVMGGGMLLSTVMKRVVGRVRPPEASMIAQLPVTHSLPSGHTMAAVLFAAAVVYLFSRTRAGRASKVAVFAAAGLWAVAVGFSRVYLGVHWPTDVFASWLLAGSWIALVAGVMRATRPQGASPSQLPA